MKKADVIADLGYLALGTRLKRLADQLQAGVGEVLAESGDTIQPGQLPLLVVVGDEDGLTIAELVKALGVSQPAISRMLAGLQRGGFVTMIQDKQDARIRRVSLTEKSRVLLGQTQATLFPKVATAAEQLCEGLDLLHTLETVEQRLRECAFADRIRRSGR
jgi:DNA-binding MarR family transcriptional regulator